MGGHLFIIDGDLTKIACDAILIPTDDDFRINNHWATFLGDDHQLELAQLRQNPARGWGSSTVKPLECVAEKPQVWLGKIGRADGQLDFTKLDPSVTEFVKMATEEAKSRNVNPIYNWPLPRLAVNIVGSDHGGGSQKKGHLVRGLVHTLSDLANEHGVDIVLVAFGAKSYAAAQRARRQRIGVGDENLRLAWPFENAPVDLLAAARELAHQAINSHLVLFVGAGVSMGAGLQPWKDLLRDVAATEAMFTDHALEQLAKRDPRDQATILERRLESLATTLKTVVARRLEKPCYALAHGLLASLPSKEAVTTNFDELFETAWTTGNRSLAILPDSAVDTGGRWLLKLHGSVTESHKMILTRSDYLDMPRQYGALIGLVQGLLMMRHMMFVGYSLQDEDFHELIHEVRVAQGYKDGLKLRGTVLTLQEDELDRDLWRQDLVIVPMSKPRVSLEVASRQLEMFLDLVGYLSATSAAFFLDETYDELSKDETILRDALNQLVQHLDGDPKSREDDTVAYKVRHFLREELGADVKDVPN